MHDRILGDAMGRSLVARHLEGQPGLGAALAGADAYIVVLEPGQGELFAEAQRVLAAQRRCETM